MVIRTIDEDGTAFRILDTFDEGIFLLTQNDFIDTVSITLNYIKFTKSASVNSWTEFTALPPQAKTILSIFLLLALLNPIIPSLANFYKQIGSIPFSLMTTNVLSVLSQTFFLKSMIFWHLSSVNFLSLLTILSLSPAFEKKNWEFTSVFSYYNETLQVKM